MFYCIDFGYFFILKFMIFARRQNTSSDVCVLYCIGSQLIDEVFDFFRFCGFVL